MLDRAKCQKEEKGPGRRWKCEGLVCEVIEETLQVTWVEAWRKWEVEPCGHLEEPASAIERARAKDLRWNHEGNQVAGAECIREQSEMTGLWSRTFFNVHSAVSCAFYVGGSWAGKLHELTSTLTDSLLLLCWETKGKARGKQEVAYLGWEQWRFRSGLSHDRQVLLVGQL